MKKNNKIKYIKQLELKIKLLEENDKINELNLLKEKIKNSLLLKKLVAEKRKNYFLNLSQRKN